MKREGGQVLQYNKINSRIYYHEYATASRAIKKIKTGKKVIFQDLTPGILKEQERFKEILKLRLLIKI
jgi:hypothetical protein